MYWPESGVFYWLIAPSHIAHTIILHPQTCQGHVGDEANWWVIWNVWLFFGTMNGCDKGHVIFLARKFIPHSYTHTECVNLPMLNAGITPYHPQEYTFCHCDTLIVTYYPTSNYEFELRFSLSPLQYYQHLLRGLYLSFCHQIMVQLPRILPLWLTEPAY